MYVIFGFTLVAVFIETIGIALLLPLIEMIEGSGGSGSQDAITQTLYGFLEFFGLEQSISGILLLIGGVFIVKGGIQFTSGTYNTVVATNLQKDLKKKMYDWYERMNYSYYSNQNTGHFINVLIGQTHRLISGFFTFKGFLAKIIMTVFYLSFAFILSWQFALMAVIAGLFYLIIFSRLNAVVKDLSRKTTTEYTELNKRAVEQLQAFKYLKATGQFSSIKYLVTNSIDKLSAYARKFGILKAFTGSVKEPFIILLLIVIIIIQLTVFQAAIAPIIVALVLIKRAMSQVMSLQSGWHGTINYIGPIEMVEKEFDQLQRAETESGQQKIDGLKEGIELENVRFGFKPELEPLFRELNLNIKANQSTAFVGSSGSGKTTLMDLVTMLHQPQAGEILIDGTSSKLIDPLSWRSLIGYVGQEPVVFDDTVAGNISLKPGEAAQKTDIAGIRVAAEQAGISEFIDSLPDGYDTVVGDRGVRLSGGQKQRLCIARELYRKPRILILDEATSALDSESEALIKESIDALKGRLTILIIAHRLSTIRNADHIFFLENGRITDQGTYEELTDKDSSFSRMAEMQRL